MLQEPSQVRRLLGQLKRAPPQAFPISGKRLSVPPKHGVYIIYSPSFAVLHVGRTVHGRRGLRQRLNNHLHGASSFAIQHLKGHGARLRRNYKFAYVEIADARLRALVESLAVGTLCPKHLGVGEIAA